MLFHILLHLLSFWFGHLTSCSAAPQWCHVTHYNILYTVPGLKNSSLYFLMVVFTGAVACCLGTCGKNRVKTYDHISGREKQNQ